MMAMTMLRLTILERGVRESRAERGADCREKSGGGREIRNGSSTAGFAGGGI